jgi:hypothetical protein
MSGNENSARWWRGLFHPSSFRLHPFLSDAAASDLDRQDQRRSFAGAD